MTKTSFKLSGGLVAILLTLILLGAFIVLAYFVYDQIDTLHTAEMALSKATAKKTNLEQLQQLVNATPGGREAINRYFVTTENLPVFIETLERLASSTPVTMVLTGAAVTDEATSSVRLTFTVEASFPRLFQFISRIDALPYALHFTDAQLANQTSGSGAILKRSWQGAFAIDVLREPVPGNSNGKAKPKK